MNLKGVPGTSLQLIGEGPIARFPSQNQLGLPEDERSRSLAIAVLVGENGIGGRGRITREHEREGGLDPPLLLAEDTLNGLIARALVVQEKVSPSAIVAHNRAAAGLGVLSLPALGQGGALSLEIVMDREPVVLVDLAVASDIDGAGSREAIGQAGIDKGHILGCIQEGAVESAIVEADVLEVLDQAVSEVGAADIDDVVLAGRLVPVRRRNMGELEILGLRQRGLRIQVIDRRPVIVGDDADLVDHAVTHLDVTHVPAPLGADLYSDAGIDRARSKIDRDDGRILHEDVADPSRHLAADGHTAMTGVENVTTKIDVFRGAGYGDAFGILPGLDGAAIIAGRERCAKDPDV